VTITESYVPPACTSESPWVFKWKYDKKDRGEIDLLTMNDFEKRKSGSWNTEDGSNVFNLVNNCTPGQGGGGDTSTTPVKPVQGKGSAVSSSVLPAELPLTGQGSTSATWFALLAALLTYGAVYYLQPKKRLEQ
jgi:hypothetical protein